MCVMLDMLRSMTLRACSHSRCNFQTSISEHWRRRSASIYPSTVTFCFGAVCPQWLVILNHSSLSLPPHSLLLRCGLLYRSFSFLLAQTYRFSFIDFVSNPSRSSNFVLGVVDAARYSAHLVLSKGYSLALVPGGGRFKWTCLIMYIVMCITRVPAARGNVIHLFVYISYMCTHSCTSLRNFFPPLFPAYLTTI